MMTDAQILARCLPYTCVGEERLAAWIEDVRKSLAGGNRGHVVECGVYHGGCIFAAAFVAHSIGTGIPVLAFDTFTGMTLPGPHDTDHSGRPAAAALAESPEWRCACSWLQFWHNHDECGCPNNVGTIRGDILATVPRHLPRTVSALRLDMDWHDLTAHALAHFPARLENGAPVHIDDYGHWRGARKATDDFLTANPGHTLEPIDYSGVRLIRPA